MNKYEILENKLEKINQHIDKMQLDNQSSMNYLMQYKQYVEKLITAIQEKTIRNSKGVVVGLIRGISDYDEICEDEELWYLVTDADNYYSKECKIFD